jgi:hypothetical protein
MLTVSSATVPQDAECGFQFRISAMTGYTVHTGASKKFVSGWDRVFGDDSSSGGKAATRGNRKSAGDGAAKSAAAKSGKGRKKSS